MNLTLIIVVQWLHVLLGTFWLGSTLYADVILVPTLFRLPLEQARAVSGPLGQRAKRIIVPVAIIVVVLGFLRGTLFGSLHSLGDVFGSRYGVTWLIALLTGVALITFVLTLLTPALDRLNSTEGEQFTVAAKRVSAYSVLELAFFAVLLTCMILMRFGL
jgi:uncharacterized membrane protein